VTFGGAGVICRRLVIAGRVQGVGYRDWLATQARVLGVDGWVRNRADGTVEALVCGASDAVETLLRQCRRGPMMADVTEMRTLPADPPAEPGFYRLPTA
jgi:acylphosphatase